MRDPQVKAELETKARCAAACFDLLAAVGQAADVQALIAWGEDNREVVRMAVLLTPTISPNTYADALDGLQRTTGLPDVVIGAAAAVLFRHLSWGNGRVAEIAQEIERFAAPYLARDPL